MSARDTGGLPPLPASQAHGDNTTDFHGRPFEYTAEQMRAYANSSIAQYVSAVVILRTAIQLHQESDFNSEHPALEQAMRATVKIFAPESKCVDAVPRSELAK